MKKIVWSVIGILIIVVLITLATLTVFKNAISPYQKSENEAVSLVKNEKIMKQVQQFYWQRGTQDIYTLFGQTEDNRDIYAFIIDKKTVHLYDNSQILSESRVNEVFNTLESQATILEKSLGWYQNEPTWLFIYKTNESELSYLYISALDGRIIKQIKSV